MKRKPYDARTLRYAARLMRKFAKTESRSAQRRPFVADDNRWCARVFEKEARDIERKAKRNGE